MLGLERTKSVLLAVGCVGAVACGGGNGAEGGTGETTPATQPAPQPQPAGPVSKQGDEVVTATVSEAGGTLSLRNGAKLTIPEGALAEPTEVTLGPGAHTEVFTHREGTKAIGPILQVEPAMVAPPGARFELSLPFERGLPSGFSQDDLALGVEMMDEQRALQMGGMQTRWQNFPARVQGGRLLGELDELPGMRLQFLVAR